MVDIIIPTASGLYSPEKQKQKKNLYILCFKIYVFRNKQPNQTKPYIFILSAPQRYSKVSNKRKVSNTRTEETLF